MAIPSPEQLREKAGLQSKGFKLAIPSPAELRNKISGAFSIPKAEASTKYPSPQQLRASVVAAPLVSQETEAPVLTPEMQSILRINQTKPPARELKDIPTTISAAPKPTTKQKIVNFFRTTPVLKDITEGLFGVPEAERAAFEPRSSISDSMTFEQFLASEEAKKTLEKANKTAIKARGTPLSLEEQEDVLDFKYNQEEQETKIANQGILGFLYENLLKTDNKKIEDRYNKLRLAGIPADRATQVAAQDVFSKSKNFNDQIKESLARKLAEQNGVPYKPVGGVVITPEEEKILKAQGLKEVAMQGLESLDFLGIGSIVRKGGTTIGKPALRELEKIATREGIFDFFKKLFSKVDDVPEGLVDDLTEATFKVQQEGFNKLGGTQTQLDEAIAKVLKDSGKSSLVTKKAGEEVIKLQNLVGDGARKGDEVAKLADEVSDLAENSLKRDATGVRESSVRAFRETPEKAAQGEIRLRQLDDGRVVIEDGRQRLDAARTSGILPRIVDVSQNYDPKVVSDKVQEIIRKFDDIKGVPVEQAGKLADDTALGAKFAGENTAEVAAKGADETLDLGVAARKELNDEIAKAPEVVKPRLVSAAEKAQQYDNADDFVNSFGTRGANSGAAGFNEAKAIAENTKSGNLSDFFYKAKGLPIPKEPSALESANPVLYKQAAASKTVEDFYKTITKGEGELSAETKESLGNFYKRVKEEVADAPTATKITKAAPKAEPEVKKVVTKKEAGTAPARRADDLRTALSSPKRVAEEAIETQRKVSGTLPDGSTVAAELGQAKKIPATPAKAARYATKEGVPLEIPDETRMAWLQRKIQDKFNRLNLIQKKISESKGLPISDDLNAYLQQEMFHGRAAERLDKFEAAIVSTKGQKGKALLERMADDGISIDEMGEFLHAKHAPARNRRVAKINPDIPDGGSGLTFKQADEIIEKYRGSGKLEKMEEYAKEVYEKITKARLKILEEEHLLKPEAVDNIARAFDDDTYVPLKIDQKPEIRLRGGRGFDVRGKDVKRLKGSTKAERNNPLIQAIVDYEDAVIKAEKNKVGRSLKKLIEQNPNITNQQGQKIWEVAAQKYAPVYNKFGEVEFVKPAGYKLADNVMEVRDKGQIFHITMHDEALASAMKNLGSERGIQILHQISNYLRAVTTFYNPEFMITNFERDIQAALINTAGEQGTKAAGRVAKDVPAALRGIWRQTRGKGSKANLAEGGIDWVKEYAELKEVGGRVGWFDSATLAEKQAQIQKRINRFSGKGTLDKAARTWDGVAEWVSDINESVESGVRLSAYVNAKKAGMTKEQAASLAKNLTVNFNKKGEWGSAINSLYLFANAGIQGTARVFKALKHKRTRRIVAGIAAFSYGVNYMNEQINGEAYAKIPDYEKNTNLIFMLPAGAAAPDIDAKFGSVETIPNTNEKYIKLKLPYGYNIFKVMGDVSYEMSLGKKRIGDSLKRLLFAMDESFNPLSSGSAAQLVAPSVADPVVQMYENKNYFGGKIKPDQEPYGAEKKQSDLYFSTVRQPTKLFTKWLNDVSGGNEVEAGLLDFSPENVDHIIDFLGGGVSKFFANTIETGVSLAQGDLPAAENTPFVRKFIGDVYDDVEKSIYYDLLNKSETRLLNKQEIEDLKKYGKEALAEGQLTQEQAKKTITSMLTNQNKIHAGRIFEKIKDAPKEERKAIYQEYLKENGLEKRDAAIQKQLKEVISGYKTSKEDPQKRGFVGTLIDGGKGLFVDPQNVLKAMFTEEKLGKVEGNLVELQRFYGLDYREDGGSQEKKRRMMAAQGLDFDKQAGDYKLEHIVPVKAGGDTSDENLAVISTDEHDSYTPVDVALAAAVQAGRLTRAEASDIARRMKVEKSITPQEAFEEIKAKAK